MTYTSVCFGLAVQAISYSRIVRRGAATDDHLVTLDPLGLAGRKVGGGGHQGVPVLLQPGQPVLRRLFGCQGFLAGIHQSAVVELRRAAPEVQFVKVVVLATCLTSQFHAAADLVDQLRRQPHHGIVAVPVEVGVGAVRVQDDRHRQRGVVGGVVAHLRLLIMLSLCVNEARTRCRPGRCGRSRNARNACSSRRRSSPSLFPCPRRRRA